MAECAHRSTMEHYCDRNSTDLHSFSCKDYQLSYLSNKLYRKEYSLAVKLMNSTTKNRSLNLLLTTTTSSYQPGWLYGGPVPNPLQRCGHSVAPSPESHDPAIVAM